MAENTTYGPIPSISVCMATRNGVRFIREQMATILCQLGPDDELVVSDDSSDDGTVEIMAEYADPRLRFLPGNRFFSPIFNFENALKHATRAVIVLADQDDVWLPGKLDQVRECFRRATVRPYLVVLDAQVVDEAGQELFPSVLVKLQARPGFWWNLYNNRYLGCCMAFSRDLLGWALPFPRNIPMHDMWLGQLCERVGMTAFIPIVTMKYRKHGANLTEFRIRFRPWQQLRWRGAMLWHLVRRSRA